MPGSHLLVSTDRAGVFILSQSCTLVSYPTPKQGKENLLVCGKGVQTSVSGGRPKGTVQSRGLF